MALHKCPGSALVNIGASKTFLLLGSRNPAGLAPWRIDASAFPWKKAI